MDCDLVGMREPWREGERLSPCSHTDSILGASSSPAPGQASPVGSAQSDFTSRPSLEGCMDRAAPGLAASALYTLGQATCHLQCG